MKQDVNLGVAGDTSTGDNIRDAFDKCNDNFTEVYSDIVNLQTDDANDVTQVNGRTGNVVLDIKDSKYAVSVISASTTAVSGTVYVFTANLILTLPASPVIGDTIKISNLSQVDTCSVARNGSKILGAAADLTLDNQYSSFELVFTGDLKGWVIIGQN
tara:strand:+ start:1258 stop:1731 length:474 start_codon:yes stop_codon:yes gene_type:complete